METKIYTDQLGRRVNIPFPPRRIVSLVPSQTELLYHLGANVVGITKFCIHPSVWFRTKTRIGGTKQLHLDIIRSLSPDLIIANKEENDATQVKALMDEFPVWVSDIHTLEDALEMIKGVGEITGLNQQASELTIQISNNFSALIGITVQHSDFSENEGFRKINGKSINQHNYNNNPTNFSENKDFGKISRKSAYFIWKDPWMVAGGDTFIHEMMKVCGFQNIFADSPRYPVVTLEELKGKDCQLVLLSSEPYPFKEKHIAELQKILPAAKILLVDGEMYSWYGSRLLAAPAYFRSLVNLITP